MANWKDQLIAKKEPLSPDPVIPDPVPLEVAPVRRPVEHAAPESVIAAGLTIEGKIEGKGDVRIAGRFKGDAHVQGNLTIGQGAKLTGSVKADTVIIGGELDGNIDAASQVQLLATGVLTGDLKAGSLTVAAGSRMRGQAEFGWQTDAPAAKPKMTLESASAVS